MTGKHLQEKRQQQSRQVILTSAVQAALAYNTVSPPLKPYAENRSRYHPMTGTGCTGLPDEFTKLSDKIAQPSAESRLVPPETLIPVKADISEEFYDSFAKYPMLRYHSTISSWTAGKPSRQDRHIFTNTVWPLYIRVQSLWSHWRWWTLNTMSHEQCQLSHIPEQSDTLPNDPSSEEEQDPTISTMEEEQRGTIPGSTIATAMALAGQQAVSNPVIEWSKPRKVKKRTSQPQTGHAATQTESVGTSKQ